MNKNLTLSLAILGLGVFYCLYTIILAITGASGTYQELTNAKSQVTQLQQQIEDIKKSQAEHERIEKGSSRPIYKNEIATDDPMSSFGVMFEDVIQAAKYNKLKLYSISYDMAPANDVVFKEFQSEYNVCEITMQLIGKYPDFRSYFQDIYNYPYLINISKIEIKPYEKDKNILIGDIKIVLYSKKA